MLKMSAAAHWGPEARYSAKPRCCRASRAGSHSLTSNLSFFLTICPRVTQSKTHCAAKPGKEKEKKHSAKVCGRRRAAQFPPRLVTVATNAADISHPEGYVPTGNSDVLPSTNWICFWEAETGSKPVLAETRLCICFCSFSPHGHKNTEDLVRKIIPCCFSSVHHVSLTLSNNNRTLQRQTIDGVFHFPTGGNEEKTDDQITLISS